MIFRSAALVLLVLVPASFGQEVSQSGLELTAPRAMVEEPVRAPHAMVASVNPYATQAGLEVLHRGGNAVDAAIAVAVALAVVHPEAGNLGGSGHMLIRMNDGRTAAIDYSGTAPAAAHEVAARDLLIGYKSAVVPGTPAGLGLAHDTFGHLPWRDCLQPAYTLARKGFPASQRMELILKLQVPVMKSFPASAKLFLHGSDRPLRQGEWVVQPELAATLRRLQNYGWREFYTGKTARLIAADMAAHGGWMTLDDLRNYRAVLHQPIRAGYRGYSILTIPPAASGGVTLAVALNVLADLPPLPLGAEGSSIARHEQIEALRCGFEAARLLETAGAGATLQSVLAPDYARAMAATVHADRATPGDAAAEAPESHETTDFSVVDAQGNVVTNTYTLSGFYGSQVVVAGAGFLLNNSMSVFSTRAHAVNRLTPGARYVTTMADTIVLNPDGSPLAAFGSPGASTIPSTVLQVVNNLIDFHMSLRDAITFPRVHYDLPHNRIEAEPGALVLDVADRLRSMGYELDPHLRSQGDVDAVMIDPVTHWRVGAADARRGGQAAGY